MNINLCFNYKLSKSISVFDYYICSMNYCNEWMTEEYHECAKRGKLQTT